MKRIAFFVILLLGLLQAVAVAKRLLPPQPPQPVHEPKRIDAAELLRALDISPTPDGVAKFLADVERGRFAPPAPDEIDRLIAALGSDTFREREQAGRTLAALIRPPLDKLRKAAIHEDLEISRRARQILMQIETRPDPVHLLFLVVKDRKLDVPVAQLAELASHSDRPPTLELAHDLLLPRLNASDGEQIKRWLESANASLRATGVRALPKILSEDALAATLARYLKDDGELVRGMAARTFVSHVTSDARLEKLLAATHIDTDALALVYRAAERQFRQSSKDLVHEPKTAGEFEKLARQYAEALTKTKGVKRELRPPANTPYWLELGLRTEKHPEILLYRIRWFNGQWSPWYAPGYNDMVGDGRAIRFWSCFNDHEHEVISTTRAELYRLIDDLP
jgi:hypothetical protein